MNIVSVLAPNPGLFTGPGTNTYVVEADGEAAIIDPGPVIDAHQAAVIDVASASTVVGVFVTHTHPDHAPAANVVGETFDVPVYGFGPGPAFTPSHTLVDGAEVAVGNDHLMAIHTPGHTADHLCYRSGDVLFTGDHIMGGSTVVIEDAAAYMASLHKTAELGANTIYPGHGPVLPDAAGAIAEYIAHRTMREHQIVSALRHGAGTVGDLVEEVYAEVDPALHAAAAMQVIVQLRKLHDEGRVWFPPGGADWKTPVEVSKETES